MSTKVKQGGGSNVTLPEPGTYIAICHQLIFTGTNSEQFGTQEAKMVNKLRIQWELPTEKVVFKEGEEEKPFVVNKEFTNSSSDRGNLFKWLSNWSPKITKENFHQVDLADVLGKPCMITIAHNPDKKNPTRIYLEATSVSAIPKDLMDKVNSLKQFNPDLIFDVEEFDQEAFNKLPKFIRTKALSSEEFKASNLNTAEVENIAAEVRGENIQSEDSQQDTSAEDATNQISEDTPEDNKKSDSAFF